MRPGASLSHVSQYNENAVIHALRVLGPTSQTDIAAQTGLSSRDLYQAVLAQR